MTDVFDSFRPAARECERVPLVVTKDTESGRAAASAQRLEDVEKFVREIRAQLDEIHEWVFECHEALCGRIELLEDELLPGVVLRLVEPPSEHE